MTFPTRLVCLLLLLTPVLLQPAFAEMEIRAEIVDVDQGGEVRLSLSPDAVVTVGDRVRIEGEVPGIGWLAIRTEWKISYVSEKVVWAAPDGKVSGMPQVGYRATVYATAPQVKASEPDKPAPAPTPEPKIYSGVHECDRLAAQEYDDEAVAPGVSYTDINAQAVIRACTDAIVSWPDTPRFYTQVARGYHKAGEMQKAYEAAKAGADRGSAQAMAFLAIFYKTGAYVAKDPAQSLRWFEKAGKKGNIAAMVFAGSMYNTGEGAPPNPSRAAYWYGEAAGRGNGEAMANLAMLHDAGIGVQRDPGLAAGLLLQSLKLGNDAGRRILFENAQTLSPATRRSIQMMLRSSGYYTGAIDGKFGPGTRRALEALAGS
ncbi:peptidoglycan-binding protein [uncultured Roseibium sp.]|uniref:peptidoglycan-binding protein n=1 Tax=uncultured Roseibium sp. TaxID=1936171 RepID=UPI003217FB39